MFVYMCMSVLVQFQRAFQVAERHAALTTDIGATEKWRQHDPVYDTVYAFENTTLLYTASPILGLHEMFPSHFTLEGDSLS